MKKGKKRRGGEVVERDRGLGKIKKDGGKRRKKGWEGGLKDR
jgi:hypothetical protein